jgi:hypothetical protein
MAPFGLCAARPGLNTTFWEYHGNWNRGIFNQYCALNRYDAGWELA